MSERITAALKSLADAVIDEANDAVIKPILTGAAKRSLQDALFGKDGLFSNLNSTPPAAPAPKTNADPAPFTFDVTRMAEGIARKSKAQAIPNPADLDSTDAREMARVFIGVEKVDSIIALKKAGKSDDAIAEFLNVSVDAVKLF